MEDTKYPDIRVQLTGNDGNAMSIMARVTKAMRRAGVPKEKRDEFIEEATSGDYNDLLATAMRWIDAH